MANLIGIVTAAQKGEAAFSHRKTMPEEEFIKFVAKLDAGVSGYRSVLPGSKSASSSSAGATRI